MLLVKNLNQQRKNFTIEKIDNQIHIFSSRFLVSNKRQQIGFHSKIIETASNYIVRSLGKQSLLQVLRASLTQMPILILNLALKKIKML